MTIMSNFTNESGVPNVTAGSTIVTRSTGAKDVVVVAAIALSVASAILLLVIAFVACRCCRRGRTDDNKSKTQTVNVAAATTNKNVIDVEKGVRENNEVEEGSGSESTEETVEFEHAHVHTISTRSSTESSTDTDSSTDHVPPSLPTHTEPYALHKAAFEDDIVVLNQLMTDKNVTEQDVHGNTALHLASMLGHTDCIECLLEGKAPANLPNKAGWTSMDEAVSFGNREIIQLFYNNEKAFVQRETDSSWKPHFNDVMDNFDNFCAEFKWDLRIPIVTQVMTHTRVAALFSDTWKAYKQGRGFRLDTKLASLVYNPHKEAVYFLDHTDKIYQRFRHDDHLEEVTDETIDAFMATSIQRDHLVKEGITIKARKGWLRNQPKPEKIGPYEVVMYDVEIPTFQTKRREHLSDRDIKKMKMKKRMLLKSVAKPEDTESEISHRDSLTPPPKPKVTWRQYITAPPGKPPQIGRKHVLKTKKKKINFAIGMCRNFPITFETAFNAMRLEDFIAKVDKNVNAKAEVAEVKDWLQKHLPPGMPIKIQYYFLPGMSATLAIQQFDFKENTDESLFVKPDSYKRSRHHFTPNKERRLKMKKKRKSQSKS